MRTLSWSVQALKFAVGALLFVGEVQAGHRVIDDTYVCGITQPTTLRIDALLKDQNGTQVGMTHDLGHGPAVPVYVPIGGGMQVLAGYVYTKNDTAILAGDNAGWTLDCVRQVAFSGGQVTATRVWSAPWVP
jgi:hypothetical protein